MVQLADQPSFAGSKDSCQDPIQYQEMVRQLGKRQDFSILRVTTKLATYSLFVGADGIVDGLHTVKPEWAVGLWDAPQAGAWETPNDYQLKLESLMPFADHEEWLGGVELVLREMWLCDKITTGFLVSLSDPEVVAPMKALMLELALV